MRYFYLSILLICLLRCAPGKKEFTKSTFDSPFPKGNIKLTSVLGEQIKLKQGDDTLLFKIISTRAINSIIFLRTGDTLFKGKVCKYRGLYYFNEQINDTSYWIYSVKIYDNLIYGFNTALYQTFIIDGFIERGEFQKLVKYKDLDNNIIRLRVEKKELKRLFTSIIDSFPADTILADTETAKIKSIEADLPVQIDQDDNDFVTKVYPNPTIRFLNVNLKSKNLISYQLVSLDGKVTMQGNLNQLENKLDLKGCDKGIYILTIHDPVHQQMEQLKIIKE